MNMTKKAKAIVKLLEQGYSPSEITKRMDASYNYAWKLKTVLDKQKAAAKAAKLSTAPDLLEALSQGKGKPKPEVEETKSAQADTSVNAILNQRGSRYGNFLDHARITYKLKEVARNFAEEKGKTFAVDQCEAMDMIFHKIGRILNGDPDYADSWVDIAGYAQLVADRLQGKAR